MESQTTGFPSPLSPRLLWTSSPIYGIVHPTNCQICRQFMVHLAEASRADDDPSFNVALKERDFQRNSYYLNGVCEGRRLQREYSQTWVDQRDIYRAERDAAVETASQQFVDLCAVREELEKLREEHRALQDLFEEVVESGVRNLSRTDNWSPSIEARILEESLYDAHHRGFEGDFGVDSWVTLPDSLTQEFTQIPTPPESTTGSVPWRTTELPPLTDNTYLEDFPITPANIPDISGSYPSPTSSVIEVAPPPEEAPTFVEERLEEARVSSLPQTPKNVTELQALMNEAYAGNESALVRIKSMCTEAHATPRHRKTFIQQFLLSHWKGIPGRGRPVPVQNDAASPPVVGSTTPPNLEIFVDSAPSWGIGFVKDGRWLAWKLKKGWNTDGRDNSWGEMVAVELGLRAAIAAGDHSRTIIVRSDNAGVVRSLCTGISRNFHQNMILQKVLQLSRTYNVRIVPKWISTKSNPADKPSRGVFASRALLFSDPPPLPAHLVDFIHPPVEFRALAS